MRYLLIRWLLNYKKGSHRTARKSGLTAGDNPILKGTIYQEKFYRRLLNERRIILCTSAQTAFSVRPTALLTLLCKIFPILKLKTLNLNLNN